MKSHPYAIFARLTIIPFFISIPRCLDVLFPSALPTPNTTELSFIMSFKPENSDYLSNEIEDLHLNATKTPRSIFETEEHISTTAILETSSEEPEAKPEKTETETQDNTSITK
jgi:hypothetical protein